MTFTPRAIVVDDEKHVRDYLVRLLEKTWPELSIAGEVGDGEQALNLIHELQPDIVFLDIRMPGLDGITVAQKLNTPCHIIFVTAYNDYAVDAFEQAAVDYLLKPVTEERLHKTIDRLKEKMQNPANTQLTHDVDAIARMLLKQEEKQRINWLKVSRQKEIKILSIDSVDFFQSQTKYTSVYAGGQEWVIRTPLKELEATLDVKQFWRIHRSVIVRVAAIEHVNKDLAGRFFVHIRGYNKPLSVSRSYAHRFKID